MKGTEKQISWAKEIKAKKLARVDGIKKDFDKAASSNPGLPGENDIREMIEKARSVIENKDNAVWFINNRHIGIRREHIQKLAENGEL